MRETRWEKPTTLVRIGIENMNGLFPFSIQVQSPILRVKGSGVEVEDG
jgi:hypothetical protein